MFITTCVCIVSCGNGSQGDSQQEPSAIKVQMEWPFESAASPEQSRAAIDCGAYNIDNIKAAVMDPATMLAEGGPWKCSLGSGTIDAVPAGENYLVILCAYNAGGEEIYRGEAPNVHVQKNQVVNVEITMAPVFNRSVSLVEDIRLGAESSFPHRLFRANDQLYFVASDANAGFELFVADAAGNGAQLLGDIYPFSDATDGAGVAAPSDFVELNGWLYFRANNGSGYKIWRTNGTTANIEEVAVGAGYTNPTELTVLNNRIFFAADSSAIGRELWVYDDSTGQAQLVHDILPGSESSNPHELTVVGNALYYAADDGQHGYEVWQTNDTADATVLAADLNVSDKYSSYPSNLTEVNGRLFFIAKNGTQKPDATPPTYGLEVWMLFVENDLIEVQLTGDINTSTSGTGSSEATNMTSINDTILAFSAYEPNTGHELYLFDWQTDTAPRRITDLNMYAASSHPANFVYMNGMLYFTAHNINGIEHLWVHSLEDSQALKCLTVSSQYLAPRDLTVFNQSLYFSGLDASGSRKLWVTDGIRIGIVADTNQGAAKYSPTNLVAFTDRLFYTSFDAEHGEEVFQLSTQ
jgi:ELWxxDGT repeat protein